jgi:hypothetical protein
VLTTCRFRLILLDPALRLVSSWAVLRAIKKAAPDTPLALLIARPETPPGTELAALGDAEARLAGAGAVVPRGEPERPVRVVREVDDDPTPGGPSGPAPTSRALSFPTAPMSHRWSRILVPSLPRDEAVAVLARQTAADTQRGEPPRPRVCGGRQTVCPC